MRASRRFAADRENPRRIDGGCAAVRVPRARADADAHRQHAGGRLGQRPGRDPGQPQRIDRRRVLAPVRAARARRARADPERPLLAGQRHQPRTAAGSDPHPPDRDEHAGDVEVPGRRPRRGRAGDDGGRQGRARAQLSHHQLGDGHAAGARGRDRRAAAPGARDLRAGHVRRRVRSARPPHGARRGHAVDAITRSAPARSRTCRPRTSSPTPPQPASRIRRSAPSGTPRSRRAPTTTSTSPGVSASRSRRSTSTPTPITTTAPATAPTAPCARRSSTRPRAPRSASRRAPTLSPRTSSPATRTTSASSVATRAARSSTAPTRCACSRSATDR